MEKMSQRLMTKNYFMWVLFWTLLCITMLPIWIIILTLTYIGSCIGSVYLETVYLMRTIKKEVLAVAETYKISEYKKFKNEVSE